MAGCSRLPIFLRVKRITKTGILSCVELPATRSDDNRNQHSCSWRETPIVVSTHCTLRGRTIMVKPKQHKGKVFLECPSKKMIVHPWDGLPKPAEINYGD
jgi:hypothetical protein